jgi:hypothetical protein
MLRVLGFMILPLPPKFWDYRHAPSYLLLIFLNKVL